MSPQEDSFRVPANGPFGGLKLATGGQSCQMQAEKQANASQSRSYNNSGYLPNGASGTSQPGAAPLLPNQGRVIQTGPIRVLCIADVRGAWMTRLAPQ